MSRAVLPPPVRVPERKQSAGERQRMYDLVTARDMICRAAHITVMQEDPLVSWDIGECSGRLERHHAGVGIGSNRNELTDARHVVLLCEFHHRTWAPSHSRLILEWLARVEDARERGGA